MYRRFLLLLLSFSFLEAVAQPRGAARCTPELLQALSTPTHDSIDLTVSYHTLPSPTPLSYRVTGGYEKAGILTIRTSRDVVTHLLRDNNVRFIGLTRPPVEELTTGAVDYSLNGITELQAQDTTLRGAGLRVAVKERLVDTLDIDYRDRLFRSGLEHPTVTAHASLMTTIIAGAGNTSLLAYGVAPAAAPTSVSFNSLLPEPPSFYSTQQILVQNHSYGTVIENFYGNEAMAYDVSVVAQPTLLHVFSAGNSGGSNGTGIYTGLPGRANLTGNFKQSKNTLAVTGVDSLGRPLPLSSRGPAYDGRLKPELAAYGEDGSSGAAALVSGTALLVQDAYRQQQGGMAPAALIKAVLINSARDIGPAGIDFITGYGSLQAVAAVQTIRQGRYALMALTGSQGEATLPLNIPAAVHQLKLTLSWTDPASAPNAARALVNDLDLELVNNATGERWRPWVLSSHPHEDSLSRLPQRGRDSLNTMEQITLSLPSPGAYTIRVTPAHLQTASQPFALAWQLDSVDAFRFTFPAGGTALRGGQTALVRWQGTRQDSGIIELSLNGGPWRESAGPVSLQAEALAISLPDTLAQGRLRMRFPNGSQQESGPFVTSPLLTLQTGFNCTDSFQLYWPGRAGATYQLYRFDGVRMRPFLQTGDTSVVLNKQTHSSIHYAVAPLAGSLTGFRSYTVSYPSQGAGCFLRSFFLESQENRVARFRAELGTLSGVRSVQLQKQEGSGYRAAQPAVTPGSTVLNFTDSSLTRGENHYRLQLLLQGGGMVYSGVETVYYLPENEGLLVYPNPVRRGETVRVLAPEAGRYTLRLYQATGTLLMERALNSTVTTLSTTSLPAGIYLLRVADREGRSRSYRLWVQ
jgi:hypothetical protein